MPTLVIRRPDDFHVHLRQGAACSEYAKDAARAGWARVLVMPNTLPPVIDAFGLRNYQRTIESAAPSLKPLMTFQILPSHTEEDIRQLKHAGAIAGKLYPDGVTTNSDTGIRDLKVLFPVLNAMQQHGLVLCIHGEDPAAPLMEREARFLKHLKTLQSEFPNLKIVLEHVSSQKGVQAVLESGPRVAATVTLHHLLYTTDDLAGHLLNPHLYCKPILKSPADRKAIQEVVLSGNAKFFFGSDSAPHPREHKEGPLCKAGIYTMPVSLPVLAQFFEEQGVLNLLEPFVSQFGAEFYGLPLNSGTIRLEKEPFAVSKMYHNTVPLMAGERLPWRLASS